MAISDVLQGVEVSIVQNGETLQELSDDLIGGERTVTKYIEAKSGEEFSIHLKVGLDTLFHGDCIIGRVYVDGVFADGSIILKGEPQVITEPHVVEGVVLRGRTIKKFKFADIQTTSGDRASQADKDRAKKLGTIEVIIDHENQYEHGGEGEYATEPESTTSVSEEAVKGQGLSHSVCFGDAQQATSEDKRCNTLPVLAAVSPAAVFVFKYRSKSIESLQEMGLIPRTPSPPPLEERDPTAFSQADIIELQKQLKAHKTAQAPDVKIKRERTDGNPRPRKSARPRAGDAQLELRDDGSFREGSPETLANEAEIIVID